MTNNAPAEALHAHLAEWVGNDVSPEALRSLLWALANSRDLRADLDHAINATRTDLNR